MSQTAMRGDEAVVIAAAERRIEEEVAGLLEPDERAGLVAIALDVGVAGLPVGGVGAVLLQNGVGGEKPRRFHIHHEFRVRVVGGNVASEHHADLVGENLVALVVHHAAAVAVAVEGKPDISAREPHGIREGVQHLEGLRGWGCGSGRCSRDRC